MESPAARANMNFYHILGVQQSAPLEEICNAYRNLALKCHPSQSIFDPTEFPIRTMSQLDYWNALNGAFEVLSNSHLRAVYDVYGEQGLKTAQYKFSGDCMHIFLLSFSTVAPNIATVILPPTHNPMPHSQAHPARTAEVTAKTIDIFVTLEELFYGARKLITYEWVHVVGGLPTQCLKLMAIEIVPGTPNGTMLFFQGAGGMVDDIAIDIIMFICQLPHPFFLRIEANLSTSVLLPLKVANCGGTVYVRSLDGKMLQLNVAASPRLPNFSVLPGEGMPIMNRNERGDLFVLLVVPVPE